ncbi:MAG: DUF4998 domain-containing protein [Mangrovibacterium sp.]
MRRNLSQYLVVLLLTLWIFISCKEMDNTYKEFVVPGGITYVTKVTPLVIAGHNRVTVSWRQADPNVTQVRIWWNNKADSVLVDISPSDDNISTTIENLEEKTYAFVIISYDAYGNSSIPVEVFCTPYGDKYQAGLVSRPVLRCEYLNEQNTIIEWGAADMSNGAFATDIRYTNASGVTKTKRTLVGELSSVLEGYKMGNDVHIRTVFVPPLSKDTFYTPFAEQQVAAKISKSGWIATADSYEPTGQLPNGFPDKAIDDNENTFWHTNHTTTKPGYPHWLAIDMNQPITVTRVELTRRAGNADYFTNFRLEGSTDGTTWATLGTYTCAAVNGPQSFAVDGLPRIQHIRIFALNGARTPATTYYYAHLAEFSVFGY